jgi:hypothetical protein
MAENELAEPAGIEARQSGQNVGRKWNENGRPMQLSASRPRGMHV